MEETISGADDRKHGHNIQRKNTKCKKILTQNIQENRGHNEKTKPMDE
jgi:hypothetical protein